MLKLRDHLNAHRRTIVAAAAVVALAAGSGGGYLTYRAGQWSQYNADSSVVAQIYATGQYAGYATGQHDGADSAERGIAECSANVYPGLSCPSFDARVAAIKADPDAELAKHAVNTAPTKP